MQQSHYSGTILWVLTKLQHYGLSNFEEVVIIVYTLEVWGSPKHDSLYKSWSGAEGSSSMTPSMWYATRKLELTGKGKIKKDNIPTFVANEQQWKFKQTRWQTPLQLLFYGYSCNTNEVFVFISQCQCSVFSLPENADHIQFHIDYSWFMFLVKCSLNILHCISGTQYPK